MSTAFFDEVYNSIFSSLSGLTTNLSLMLGGLLILLILGGIGWFVGRICQRIVTSLLGYAKFDSWLSDHRLSEGLGPYSISAVLADSIHWLVLSLFLQQAIQNTSLGFLQTTASVLIALIPTIIFCLWIVILGLLIGHWLRRLIEKLDFAFHPIAAEGAEFLAIAAGLLAALNRLNFNTNLVNNAALILFGGIVLTLALGLGLGLAFSIQQNGWAPLHQRLGNGEKRETEKTANKTSVPANAKQDP